MHRIIYSLIESCNRWFGVTRFWYAVLACYLSILGFLSLNPWIRPVSRNSIVSPDKLDHALAYGGLAFIVFLCLAKSRNGVRYTMAWSIAISVSIFVGILIELAQSLLTHNRSGSVADAVANAIGAALGFIGYHIVLYIRLRMAKA